MGARTTAGVARGVVRGRLAYAQDAAGGRVSGGKVVVVGSRKSSCLLTWRLRSRPSVLRREH